MKKIFWWVMLTCMIIKYPVYAKEQIDSKCIWNDVCEQMTDFQEIDEEISHIFSNKKIDFKKFVFEIIEGDKDEIWRDFKKIMSAILFQDFKIGKIYLMRIVLIAIGAAVFTNVADTLHNHQVSTMNFYVCYMLLMTISIQSFQWIVDDATKWIQNLLIFMRALGPIYLLAVAITKGVRSSLSFYQLILILIYIVEMLVINVLIPLLHIYVAMKVLNDLAIEEYLSKFAELIELVIDWATKTLLAAVIGLNVIQGLISPAVDSVKRGILGNGVGAIPILGDAVDGVAEIVIGAAVLVKNGIGVAGALICVWICMIPILKILGMTMLYKVIAAVVQPISDRRIVGCISAIGEGSRLLSKIIFMTGILFLITIGIVAATTS